MLSHQIFLELPKVWVFIKSILLELLLGTPFDHIHRFHSTTSSCCIIYLLPEITIPEFNCLEIFIIVNHSGFDISWSISSSSNRWHECFIYFGDFESHLVLSLHPLILILFVLCLLQPLQKQIHFDLPLQSNLLLLITWYLQILDKKKVLRYLILLNFLHLLHQQHLI